MKWFYDPNYDYGRGLPVKEVHGFALDKPSRIRAALLASGVVSDAAFIAPQAIDDDDVHLVHTDRMAQSLHRPRDIAAAIEFPTLALLPTVLVRRAVVMPQMLAAGGTYAALRAAADGEWAINTSGGYHHARRDLAHGFCLVNDIAIAVAKLEADGVRPRIVIVDLDLHQGDGNSEVFRDNERVFTASMHEGNVFPADKVPSDLDLALDGGIGDDEYLDTLTEFLRTIDARTTPDILVYVAGTDPFIDDPLGTLQLSREGLLRRDEQVAQFARDIGCALVAVPAGGYTDQSPAINAAGFAAISRHAPQ